MIQPEQFKRVLDLAFDAYQNHNTTKQEMRQGGKVPFLEHPMWAAMMLLCDQRIPFEQREIGYQVLLLHDVYEDTDLELPDDVDPEVKRLVQEMTLPSDFKKALVEVAQKETFVKLLILCDSLQNVYEEHVTDWKRAAWKEGVGVLIREIEREYGNIRLVHVGKAILENTDW